MATQKGMCDSLSACQTEVSTWQEKCSANSVASSFFLVEKIKNGGYSNHSKDHPTAPLGTGGPHCRAVNSSLLFPPPLPSCLEVLSPAKPKSRSFALQSQPTFPSVTAPGVTATHHTHPVPTPRPWCNRTVDPLRLKCPPNPTLPRCSRIAAPSPLTSTLHFLHFLHFQYCQ